jgi:hypothetical protein
MLHASRDDLQPPWCDGLSCGHPRVGAYQRHPPSWVIGVLAGLWYFFTGGGLPSFTTKT